MSIPVVLEPQRGDGDLLWSDVEESLRPVPDGATVVLRFRHCRYVTGIVASEIARRLVGCQVSFRYHECASGFEVLWLATFEGARAQYLESGAQDILAPRSDPDGSQPVPRR